MNTVLQMAQHALPRSQAWTLKAARVHFLLPTSDPASAPPAPPPLQTDLQAVEHAHVAQLPAAATQDRCVTHDPGVTHAGVTQDPGVTHAMLV
jgi:hypothetical protein